MNMIFVYILNFNVPSNAWYFIILTIYLTSLDNTIIMMGEGLNSQDFTHNVQSDTLHFVTCKGMYHKNTYPFRKSKAAQRFRA